jgi:hypothetical protein
MTLAEAWLPLVQVLLLAGPWVLLWRRWWAVVAVV